jgi:hypothetical protein
MKRLKESPKFKVMSVWANGEYINMPVEAVSPPSGAAPYWKVTLQNGGFFWITGQVTVKQHPDSK